MAAANAFVTTSPDARYGSADLDIYSTTAYAQEFTCGGSGDQEITEIGCYGADPLNNNSTMQLAIFTDDDANGCPGTLVANSQTTVSNTQGSQTKLTATYGGVKPIVTGGAKYWLAVFPQGTCYISGNTTGGTSVSKAATYPTFPDGDGWHSPTSSSRDYSLYAVYQAAPVASQFARPSSTIEAGNWTAVGSTLHGAIGESVASDAEYDRSGSSPVNDTMEVGLSSVGTPDAGGTIKVHVRARVV